MKGESDSKWSKNRSCRTFLLGDAIEDAPVPYS